MTAELNKEYNAISPKLHKERNSTSGWSTFGGAGAVLTSSSDVVSTGDYAFFIGLIPPDTCVYKDIGNDFNLKVGNVYKITFDVADNVRFFKIGLGKTVPVIDKYIKTTGFTPPFAFYPIEYVFVYDGITKYFIITHDDSGFPVLAHFDTFSIKKLKGKELMSHIIRHRDKQIVGSRHINVPLQYAIAEGSIRDAFAVQKFGENQDAGAVEEPLWSDSGAYTWMTSAQQIKVASVGASGGNDDGDPAGSGARTLELFGLDGDFNRINEIIVLNGTTAVTSGKSYRRFYRAIVRTVGATGWNEGALNIYDNGGANQIGHIPIGYNQTMQAIYTIPANYKAYLTRWYASSATNQTVDVFLRARPLGEAFQVKHKIHIYRGFAEERFHAPLVFDGRTDIYLSTIASASSDVAGGFDIMCLKED
jgi:hypothetical protein